MNVREMWGEKLKIKFFCVFLFILMIPTWKEIQINSLSLSGSDESLHVYVTSKSTSDLQVSLNHPQQKIQLLKKKKKRKLEYFTV